MTSTSNIFVYELTTQPNATTKASVSAECLAILERHRDADLHVWTVAATREQVINFPRLRWVIKPRQIGQMDQVGDEHIFRHLLSGETLRVPTKALSL